MLKGIPACLSPDLVHALMSMGHGDALVLADVDFPAASHARRLLRADGVPADLLLEAILSVMPLDAFVPDPVLSMDCSAWGPEPPAYGRFREILRRRHPAFRDLAQLPREAFYARAARAYAIVVTGEPDGNLILTKGPVASG